MAHPIFPCLLKPAFWLSWILRDTRGGVGRHLPWCRREVSGHHSWEKQSSCLREHRPYKLAFRPVLRPYSLLRLTLWGISQGKQLQPCISFPMPLPKTGVETNKTLYWLPFSLQPSEGYCPWNKKAVCPSLGPSANTELPCTAQKGWRASPARLSCFLGSSQEFNGSCAIPSFFSLPRTCTQPGQVRR